MICSEMLDLFNRNNFACTVSQKSSYLWFFNHVYLYLFDNISWIGHVKLVFVLYVLNKIITFSTVWWDVQIAQQTVFDDG